VEIDSASPRIAVIAGRRFRSAVARNRARRLLREACRALLRDADRPWDLLFVARTALLDSGHQHRLHALSEMLSDAGVIAHREAALI